MSISQPDRIAAGLCALIVMLVAGRPASADDTTARNIAIIGVTVVPMDSDRILPNQTVIVSGERIRAIGDTASTPVPPQAIRIDADGQYLVPGIADLHVHLRGADEYGSYVANGVTTVMHLGSSPRHSREVLSHRDEIRAGTRHGPNIYTTERIIDGDPPASNSAHRISTPDAAREQVAAVGKDGFDFIKTYNNVSEEVFAATVAEARKQGLPVIGHIPRNFAPATAFAAGLDAVVHTEEFFFTWFKGPRSIVDMDRSYRADLSTLPSLIALLQEHDVAVMPNLSFTYTNFVMWDGLENLWNDPEVRYLHPDTLYGWQVSNINRREEIENFVVRGQWKYDLMQELTREFQKAGILQVLATDASAPGLFPGKSAHRELTELVKAGLTNFEVLAIATRNAGEFVRRYIDSEARFGQLLPGYRADFVLLAENPLEDVRNMRSIRGVAVNGRWQDQAALQRGRDDLAARFAAINAVNGRVDEALGRTDAMRLLSALLEEVAEDDELPGIIEQRINSAGYAAAFADDVERAAVILEYGTQLFPGSANAWDSLAEITLYLGDRERALAYYRKALAVDPAFSNAAMQIEKLSSDPVE
jgi:hypothetical protein